MSLTSSNTQESCTAHSLGSSIELALVVVGFAGKLALGCERGRAGRLNSSDTSQAQVQDYELAHPNIYSIDELLEFMKGAVLQFQNYRISRT